jgi:aldoxime dehydratase
MESAIPVHLRAQCPRRRRVPDDYTPPYPSYVARHAESVTQVVMAYFGVQFRDTPTQCETAQSALTRLEEAFRAADGPGHWDRARCVDETGVTNVISIAYWDDPAAFDRWFAVQQQWWSSDARLADGIGYFTELLRPRVERYETLFSANDRTEGIAVLSDSLSGMIKEHAYWGGARDRIPLSQTDELAPVGAPTRVTSGGRVRIAPHDNICLIRSGQDWTDTPPDERAMYLDDVEPVLRRGMDYLRDEGVPIGCFANRYMTVLDGQGGATDKSFGMSWWSSLAALERWAESHPTHLAIFGSAMTYLSKLGPTARLRLYHEVTVARADEQFYEYLNCHPGTGLLHAT